MCIIFHIEEVITPYRSRQLLQIEVAFSLRWINEVFCELIAVLIKGTHLFVIIWQIYIM